MIENILYDMIKNSAPLILCVLGGIFAYKANVLNIALEGMMLMGAFTSALFVLLTGNLFLGILISIIITLLLGIIFAVFSITLKSNFIITGLGINLFVTAISAFVLQFMGKANINIGEIVNVSDLKLNIPVIKDIPIIGSLLSGHSYLTYFSIICIAIASILMFKTKFGTYVRVVGENEEAAKSVGIKVNAIKYASVLIGALLCALAGANLSVESGALYTDNMTAGRGFIAIAAIYCGRGMPVKSSVYAIIFGLTTALADSLSLHINAAGLFKMVPYLMIVIVLAVVSAVESRRTRLRGFKNG